MHTHVGRQGRGKALRGRRVELFFCRVVVFVELYFVYFFSCFLVGTLNGNICRRYKVHVRAPCPPLER